MATFDIGLHHVSILPDPYLDDLRDALRESELNVHEQEFEFEPYAALEWILPTAVAVYIAKPFFDAIMKKAAADVSDTMYPKLKAAISRVAKKLYVDERIPIVRINKDGTKDDSPDSVMFSIHSETKLERKLKFVFTKTYEAESYTDCIDDAFALLYENHTSADNTDSLSKQIEALTEHNDTTIYLTYDEENRKWIARDLRHELLKKVGREPNAG